MALQKTKHWLSLVLGCGILALSACNSIQQDTTGGGGGDTGTKSVSVSLSSSTLVSGNRATVTATLTDSIDGAVSGASICFTPGTLGSIVGASCVTTNASGVATTQLEAGATSGNATVTATGSGATSTANYVVNGPKLTMSSTLLNVTASNSPTATATVVDGAGAPVAGAVVSFTVGNPTFATLNPVSGTVLTDASGVASITLSPGTASGASTLTATTDVAVASTTTAEVIGTATLSGQVNFQSTTATTSTGSIKLSGLTTGVVGSLSAYGTASVTVNVLDENNVAYTTPVTVNFTSNCASQGKASIAASALTINGVATASFVDRGCGNTDTIQATLAGITATPAITTLVIAAPSIGSIQFVSAMPTNISLKGTGGAGRQETSTVSFKVVDQANNPKAADVAFTLSTTVGGIALANTTAKSDSVTGLVSVIVQAGTIPTPVRVTASVNAGSGTLTTQSDQLTISTGLPDQAHFSITPSTINIEGWRHDGVQSFINAYVADHFGNPVPDGTAISFVAEGGSVQSNCVTAGGNCKVTFTAQALRPTDGRVSILAYAIGEESFTDQNGDGYATLAGEMVDANNASTDMGEAFVDYNENKLRDAGEPFVDFDSSGGYTAKDSKLSSTLCKGTICGTSPTTHVRSQNEGGSPLVLVLSDSVADIRTLTYHTDLAPSEVAPDLSNGLTLDLQGCASGSDAGRTYTLSFDIGSAYSVDPAQFTHFNAMPKGTTISASVQNNGALQGVSSWIVGNGTDASTYHLTVKTDQTLQSCASSGDTTQSGLLTIDVTTPSTPGVTGTTKTTFTIGLVR